MTEEQNEIVRQRERWKEMQKKDDKIRKSLPKREFIFVLITIITFHISEYFRWYLDWGIWWVVFLSENLLLLYLVTGYPRYSIADLLVMWPPWIPFHMLYILLIWFMNVSFIYMAVNILFGFCGVLVTCAGYYIIHIPMVFLQRESWRV